MSEYIPPHDTQTEMAALGAAILNLSASKTLLNMLVAEDFYVLRHQAIYLAVKETVENESTIDMVLLRDKLKKRGVLEKCGGVAYIAELMECVPSSANIEYYCHLVREDGVKRRAIEKMRSAAEKAKEASEETDIGSILQETAEELDNLSMQKSQGVDVPSVSELLPEANRRLEKRAQGEVDALKTGIGPLDEKYGGIEAGELAIIRADLSVGKTAFATNILLHHVCGGGAACAFQSEVTSHAYIIDMARTLSGVDLWALEKGRLTQEQLEAWREAQEVLDNCDLWVDTTSRIAAEAIARRTRDAVREHGVSLIMVDHAQLLTTERAFSAETPRLEHISHTLKGVAQEHEIPLLLLSQETDQGDGRAQTKWASAIEEDADWVLALQRTEQYKDDPAMEPDQCKRLLSIEKGRHKGTGRATIWFNKPQLRFAAQPGGFEVWLDTLGEE